MKIASWAKFREYFGIGEMRLTARYVKVVNLTAVFCFLFE